MSNKILTIAKDEWRYWYRSKLAITMVILSLILVVASVILTSLNLAQQTHERNHLQNKAEDAFISQPDRHPHRMVHYGHYVFRTPSPLSMIDPGIDSYTGTSLFLEGHKQNSEMFSGQGQSSGLTRLSQLTPAFVLQVLVPLLLILVGYSVISRERESGTLAFIILQGTSLKLFMAGKLMALFVSGLLMLIPLVLGSLFSIERGESFAVVGSFITAHVFYVFTWCALIVWVSTLSKKNTNSFAILMTLWVVFCLIIPRISASTASSLVESAGKLETDFDVLKHIRELGDGHNVSSTEMDKLKANLMARYNVKSVEKLPVNIKGVVSQISEARLTDVLNQFAEKRMSEELAQAKIARQFGWLTPLLALRTASMTLSGTSLETHHRFLREAETLRFDFVQGLNKLHAEKLSFIDETNSNKNKESAKKASVNAENWQLLKTFRFKPDTPLIRINNALQPLAQLAIWMIVLFFLAIKTKRVW